MTGPLHARQSADAQEGKLDVCVCVKTVRVTSSESQLCVSSSIEFLQHFVPLHHKAAHSSPREQSERKRTLKEIKIHKRLLQVKSGEEEGEHKTHLFRTNARAVRHI